MLDEIRLHSTDEEDIERLFRKRQTLIEQALTSGNTALLEEISLIDKENLMILTEEKKALEVKMNQLDKVQCYVT